MPRDKAPESVPVSVRLPEELALQLEGLAIVDDENLSEQMRRGIHFGIVKRITDPEFPNEVETARIRLNGVLDGLLDLRNNLLES